MQYAILSFFRNLETPLVNTLANTLSMLGEEGVMIFIMLIVYYVCPGPSRCIPTCWQTASRRRPATRSHPGTPQVLRPSTPPWHARVEDAGQLSPRSSFPSS